MEAYSGFARVYDELMEDVPYERWTERICDCIREYGISKPERDAADALESERNLVVDLGCGTGTVTEALYRKGYDLIGIDNSPEMLTRAMEKKEEQGLDILYLCQDMRDLDLYSTVGTVVCICDSLNYLLEPEDLSETFRRIYRFLYPGGIFVFDCNTSYKYREVIGETTIAQNYEDCSFIWENWYEEGVNRCDLTLYMEEEDGTYRRYEETHLQRGIDLPELDALLKKTGFETLRILDSDTEEEPTPETERLFVVVRCPENKGEIS